MRRFGLPNIDLFGDEINDNIGMGELFLISQYLLTEDEFVSRADWAIGNIPFYSEHILLDGEDYALLDGALKAYVFGLYAAVVLSSDAFCERLLTDAVEIRGDEKSARKGFQAVIRSAGRMKILDEYVLKRILRLHFIRNNYCHEKGPDHSWRLFRRTLDARIEPNELQKSDAQEALCIMHGIAGRIKRWFPRLDLPGHPSIREELKLT